MTRHSVPPFPSLPCRPGRPGPWRHLLPWLAALLLMAPLGAVAQETWSGSDTLTSGLAALLPVGEAFERHTETRPEGLLLR